MKLSICFVFLAGAAFAQSITPGSVYQTDLSHSAALIHFSTGSNWNNLRIRYATAAEGSCTTGNGQIQASPYAGPGDGKNHQTDRMQIVVSGLLANTAYTVCPEVSNNGDQNGGGTWNGGQAVSFTTLALPAVHPALPISPDVYDPAYPDTTGYHTVTLASDCSNRQTLLDDALAHDKTYGTIIYASPSTSCLDRYEPNTNSEGVIGFNSTAVTAGGTAANSLLNIAGTGSEGQGLIFANGNYGQLPGVGAQGGTSADSPDSCTGIIPGYVYWKHVPGGDPNTFQLTCNAPFGQTGKNGAAKLMVFANGGFGNGLLVDLYPTSRFWVIMRTNVADNAFAPQETRVSPAWAPLMPKIIHRFVGETISGSFGAPACNGFGVFSTTRCDGGNPVIISHLWLMGWEVTTADFLDAETSADPDKVLNILGISRPSHNIVLDRMYIHGQGAPNRIFATIADWTGHDQVIKNSYFDKQDIYQSNYSGLNMVSVDATHFKIAGGWHALNGKNKYNQPSDITVNLTTGGNSGEVYVSAGLDGATLNVSLPPGVSGTCSGGPCNVFTTQATGAGVVNVGSHAYPAAAYGANYFVDPTFSSVSSGGTTFNLLGGQVDPTQADYSADLATTNVTAELGVKVVPNANLFLRSVRFWKSAGETGTTHTITLWDASTTSAITTATTSSETSSGWQSATFSSPPALTSGHPYIISYLSNASQSFAPLWWQNQNMVTANGLVAVPGFYAAPSGGCDMYRQWPKNWANHTRVGIIGCGAITSGSITSLFNAYARGSTVTRINDANGSNAVQSGQGPGPFLFKNNYFSVTGNGMHFNEGGQDGFDTHFAHWQRGDFSIIRNDYITPLDHLAPWMDPNDAQNGVNGYTPAYDTGLIAGSNGLYYQGRQPLEFKAGQRMNIDGNRFHGGFSNTAASIFIALTSVCDQPLSDGSFTNNTFSSGPGIIAVSDTEGGCMQTAPIKRFKFSNNLIYDIRGAYYAPGGPLGAGQGWVFNAFPHEDTTVTHNTVFLNRGASSSIVTLYDQKVEGAKFENNVFFTYNTGRGIMVDNSGYPSGPFACQAIARSHNLGGKLFADCAMINYSFSNNILFSDASQSAVQASDFWPSSSGNTVLSDPTDPTLAKWFNISSVYQAGWTGLNGPPATPNAKPTFRLRNDSPGVSGGSSRANDGTDIGVDMDAMEVAQGKVTFVGIPTSSISCSGTCSATVAFIAPDSQACPVDYSSTDATLITSFTRVADSGTTRIRNLQLSGLSSKTTYYVRVNCMVEQPTGTFVTR